MVACRDKDSYQLVCYGKRVRRNARRLEGEVRPGKWLGSGHVAERVVMMLSDILFHERLPAIKPRLVRCSALRVLLLHSCGAMFSGHWIGAVVRDPSYRPGRQGPCSPPHSLISYISQHSANSPAESGK